jgi:serine protease Do
MKQDRGAGGRAAYATIGLAMLLVCMTGDAAAQTIREPVMIAPSKRIDTLPLDANATGFFVNDAGDVLTARHVVDTCQSLYLIKDGQLARATIKAVSADQDLAVITSKLKPYLAASFIKTPDLSGGRPVFAAGYEVLRHMQDRSSMMYNALTRHNADESSNNGEMTLTSSATHGASGSPVLDQAGLVVGLVTDRAEASNVDPRAYVTRSGASSYVIALSSDPIKAFLSANNVPFTETDTPQLESMQPHAPRAATLEAGVLCGG